MTSPLQVPLQVKHLEARLRSGRGPGCGGYRSTQTPSSLGGFGRKMCQSFASLPSSCFVIYPWEMHFPVSRVLWLLGLAEDHSTEKGLLLPHPCFTSSPLICFRTALPLQSLGTPVTQPHASSRRGIYVFLLLLIFQLPQHLVWCLSSSISCETISL